MALQWRQNGHDSVSNHQPHDCLLNRLFRRRSKKTSKLCVTGLCAGNSPGTGEFPAQMASYAENVSIWWRHHVTHGYKCHVGSPRARACLPCVDFRAPYLEQVLVSLFHNAIMTGTCFQYHWRSVRGIEESWWRIHIKTLSMLLDLCEGNPVVTGGFPAQGTSSAGDFMLYLIYVRPNKRWGEVRHNDGHVMSLHNVFPAQRASNTGES